MAWPSSFAQGTRGYLQDRIADELMRSDLTTQIAAAISTAIRIYQKEFFRFTETYTVGFRTENNKWEYNLLTDINNVMLTETRQLIQITHVNCQMEDGSNMWELSREQPEETIIYNEQAVTRGQPESYSWDADKLLLSPIPNKGQGALGGIVTISLTSGGAGYASGIFLGVPLTGGDGTGATATLTVTAGVVSALELTEKGQGYTAGDILSVNALSLNITPLGPITGLIAQFTLLSGGDGFLPGTFTNVALTGGSGSGAIANIVVTDTGGQLQFTSQGQPIQGSASVGGPVTSVQITNPGVGYLEGDILSANLAPAVAGTSTGSIGNVSLLFTGPGFTNGTYNNLVLLGGTGTGATANVVVAGGLITSAVISSPGTGYTVGDSLTIPVPGANGQVAAISVFNNGFGYSPDGTYTRPTAPISGSPPGSGLTVSVVILGGIVTSVTVVNPGTGYVASLFDAFEFLIGGGIASGSGMGFQVTAVGASLRVDTLGAGGVPGLISTLSTLSGGSGYTDGVYFNVPLTGGVGLTATANIAVDGGSVTSIVIVNPGRSYAVGNVLSAVIPGGSGFSVVVASITTGAINTGLAGGFQMQVTDVADGASVTQLSGSGFTATVGEVITEASGYIISILGTWAYSEPATDSQTGNRWMTHAERLIRSRAKYELAVHVTRNEMMAQSMSPYEPNPGQRPGATYEAYRELSSAANRIVRRGVIAPMRW